MWIKIAGGARILDPDGVFDIGKRNILAVKRILWANHFGVVAENTGGDVSRTVTIHIASGEVDVAYHSQNKEKQGGERSWISGTCS
jgi:chemotaxis protein CheD